jgi:hypothetical protein
MKKQLKLFSLLSLLVITGCVTTPQAPQTTQIKCTVPKIEVIPDKVNTETQSKGGLDITIVPALYKTSRSQETTVKQIEPDAGTQIGMGFLAGLSGQNPTANSVYVEEVTTPYLTTDPGRLVFTVKIHNQLQRVFHGQGLVVQFNVDGNRIPFDNTDYKEFSGGIVPPNNDSDFTIAGPWLNALRHKGTISIVLYDVVTATDVAGNTTEKQNYTWDFSYTMQDVTETGELKTTRGWMDAGGYQQRMMQQQQASQNQ